MLVIHHTIEGIFGHIIVCRPPYRPADGPIEYIFCQLIKELQTQTFECNNLVELIHQIQLVVTNLGGFNDTFIKLILINFIFINSLNNAICYIH